MKNGYYYLEYIPSVKKKRDAICQFYDDCVHCPLNFMNTYTEDEKGDLDVDGGCCDYEKIAKWLEEEHNDSI